MAPDAGILELLWVVPALPIAGFVLLALFGRRMPRTAVTGIGVGSVGAAALAALAIAASFRADEHPGAQFVQHLWTWMSAENFAPAVAFLLDPLSLLMMLVVTVVGFLIHVYSVEFMGDDPGYSRFFAYMNLFVGMMLILVLADNLVLLYLGWEGVGLCSYLLIGFWYRDPENGRAARKAFVVTRVGDTAMGIGLFFLFMHFGTLTIRDLLSAAPSQWPVGSAMATTAAALLLGGAIGKSGQLPLQVWLPDAMAGPTPVSALIHAATMVTAGVYLIARMNVLFELAPAVQTAVAVIGAATLLVAGFSALAQRNIKRVLAYSTISQIGYMFLALGVGAYAGAMFHFFTHAFFKALLFLGAGVVINALHHEHDIFRMGGMKKEMPLVFWTFLAGAAALAAFPFVTSGFYSKDAILWQAWSAPRGSPLLWGAGVLGAFVTGLYTFRMVFVTFLGKPRTQVGHHPHWPLTAPLVILALLSIAAGFVETPETLGHVTLFSRFLAPVFPAGGGAAHAEGEGLFQSLAVIISLAGIALAWYLYGRRESSAVQKSEAPAGPAERFLLSGFGFDWVYDRLLVRPYNWMARVNRNDIVDGIYTLIAMLFGGLSALFRRTQNGNLRWYAAGVAAGAVITIAIAVLL